MRNIQTYEEMNEAINPFKKGKLANDISNAFEALYNVKDEADKDQILDWVFDNMTKFKKGKNDGLAKLVSKLNKKLNG